MVPNIGISAGGKMFNLNKSNEEMKFDSRMIDWNLKSGLITQQEYEAHLQQLADESANATHFTLEEEAAAKKEILEEESVTAIEGFEF